MFNRETQLVQNSFSYLKDYISQHDVVLDVGTGNGLLAELIRNNVGAQVIGIDVVDLNRTKSKTLLFNGQAIPFEDNKFTVSICLFMLHHARDQKTLLQEIKRVTKSTIIIFEDVPQTFFDKIFGFLHKLPSIFRYQSPRVHLRNDNAWRDVFRTVGLVLTRKKAIKKTRDFTYPISRRMYILGKQPSKIT
jgi:ubiquinone/menaquinone biosynthesis C-methylase UbiE